MLHTILRAGPIALPLAFIANPALAQTAPEESTTQSEVEIGEILVTARRRAESAQDVPIALSVLSGDDLSRQGAYSIQSVSQQAPSLQYTSSNPRNTALTIRGLGVSFGLANDGLEQGVGFYVDQVYNSRPAAAAFDLLDIDRVEVLRGPQGVLFGKNTTAGAVNITTRSPSFEPEAEVEASIGGQQFVQLKGAVSGPVIGDKLAFRVALGKTARDGFIRNVTTGRNVNDQDNLALRGQLLWRLSDRADLRLVADYALSDADCCTQVFVRAAPTLRPASRQFAALANSLGYAPPSNNPFDRQADADAPIKARSEQGGISAIADIELGDATRLTSISAWRWWDWKPANDRDYTSLDILRQSANPVQQDQLSQEVRLASDNAGPLDYTAGLFLFHQSLRGQNVTEWGRHAAFWLLGPQTANGTAIPTGLLDGYITRSQARSTIDSVAAFGQIIWRLSPRLSITAGGRYTHEHKKAVYAATVSGGLTTDVAALANAKLSIFRPQAYRADFKDGALTGDVSVAWEVAPDLNIYGSVARGFKSGGINLAGLPFNAGNNPALDRAIIDPERSTAYELGVKSQWLDRKLTANLALFRSDVRDFQANVVDNGPGALRGYLANIEKVRSQGVEADLSFTNRRGLSTYVRVVHTDARYVGFANAPCPLERTGTTTASCNLSGRPLPGTSRWAIATGGDAELPVNAKGDAVFAGGDIAYRSGFYADASDSEFMRIPGHALVNARAGFASRAGWRLSLLVRNLFDKNTLTLVTPQSGNSGLISGVPGDPRTWQLTFAARF